MTIVEKLRKAATAGHWAMADQAMLTNAADEIERLQAVAAAARECISDTRGVGTKGDVSFVMGGHRRIRLADALKNLSN